MRRSFPMFIVDSFTNVPFHGNPAAVCLLASPADDLWMQRVGMEMNLSETSFVVPMGDHWGLRWFTPKIEVDLCGHATLAASHILWETGRIAPDAPAIFETRSGRLTCRRHDEWIEMDFPAEPPEAVEPPLPLLAGLGARPLYVGRNRFDYIVLLESEAEVRRLTPDIALLDQIPARGVIVTARASETPYDFVSRFFAPQCGVPEDPVCGSAHCCLGPFWQERLEKADLLAHQVSSRSGVVHVRCAGNRIRLAGQAVTVLRGTLEA